MSSTEGKAQPKKMSDRVLDALYANLRHSLFNLSPAISQAGLERTCGLSQMTFRRMKKFDHRGISRQKTLVAMRRGLKECGQYKIAPAESE